MEWKRKLRSVLRAAGHKPAPIVRTSERQRIKGGKALEPLALSQNAYISNCARKGCEYHIEILTAPGHKATFCTYTEKTSYLSELNIPTCRKAPRKAEKVQVLSESRESSAAL